MLRKEKHPGFVGKINYKRNMSTSPYDLDFLIEFSNKRL